VKERTVCGLFKLSFQILERRLPEEVWESLRGLLSQALPQESIDNNLEGFEDPVFDQGFQGRV